MARLQPCPKCGAQFDVSAMATGTAFTCGACGAVVTAGAAAAPARTPPAPARAAVGASSRAIPAPSGATRGPQYVPVERHRDGGSPAGRARDEDEGGRHGRRGHGDREDRHGERLAPRKKGLSTGALVGISAGGLAIVFAGVLMVMSKKEPAKTTPVAGTPGGGSPGSSPQGMPSVPGAMGTTNPTPASHASGPALPAVPANDSVEQLRTDWQANGSRATGPKLKQYFARAQAQGKAAEPILKEVSATIVRETDKDFEPAHVVLGHKKFDHTAADIDGIAFREYNYIRTVEYAIEQRWFDDDDAYKQAQVAWEKTVAHQQRLLDDSTFRALDTARIAISHDKEFRDYNYEAIFASPYLICYSSDERVTKEDLAKMGYKQRLAKLTELEKKRGEFARVVTEKGQIYQQLYAKFLERYKDSCGLKPLMDEYGGRADLPPGKRSFKDGCPLIVWIFSDRKAWDEFHSNVRKDPANPNVAGYFNPGTGWVYLYDEENNRQFEVNKTVHEGTHQLEHWFQKQKRDWGQPVVPQSFFGEGFAEYIGAVTMDDDRKLTFHGINGPRIDFLKQADQKFKGDGKPLPKFPLKDLVGFEGYGSVEGWGGEHRMPNALGFFYAQSWAFVYFLNEFSNHKYQGQFNQFLNDMLSHPKPSADGPAPAGQGYAFVQFKKRMNIRSDADWGKLNKEFDAWYTKDLLTMDFSKVVKDPPPLDRWPGYKEKDPIDPRGPIATASGAPVNDKPEDPKRTDKPDDAKQPDEPSKPQKPK